MTAHLRRMLAASCTAAARIAVGVAALALAAGAAFPDAPTLTRQGMADYDAGNVQAAIVALSQAVRQNSHDPLALYYLANAYWRLDENDRARLIFGQLAALDATGSLGEQARDWLSANGSMSAISHEIRLPSVAAAAPDDSAPATPIVASDGRLHLVAPDGFDEEDDEPGTDARGNFTKLVFTRQLRDGTATFLVEAHYLPTLPSKADEIRALEQFSDVTGTLMAHQSVRDYDVIGSKSVPHGMEQDVSATSNSRWRLRGLVRGAWSGDAYIVALALAPSSGWSVVRSAADKSIATFQIADASGSASTPAASDSATADPTPAPTLNPDAPWWLRVQSDLASASPGLYAPPWGTPTP